MGELPGAAADTASRGDGGYYLAREALISLGYNFAEAETALAGADPADGVEELVKGALKKIGR